MKPRSPSSRVGLHNRSMSGMPTEPFCNPGICERACFGTSCCEVFGLDRDQLGLKPKHDKTPSRRAHTRTITMHSTTLRYVTLHYITACYICFQYMMLYFRAFVHAYMHTYMTAKPTVQRPTITSIIPVFWHYNLYAPISNHDALLAVFLTPMSSTTCTRTTS